MDFDPSAPSIRPIDIRRALLARLISVGRPLDLGELAAVLVHEFGDEHGGAAGRKRVADVMRYQRRRGRVRREGRGRYAYVPNSLSRTTEWRCVHWRAERERALGRRDDAAA